MSISQSSTRGTDHGSLHNHVFSNSNNFRYASQPSEQEPPSATGEFAAPNMVIWGTDVSVEVVKKQLMEFIRESRFTIEEAEMDEAKLEWQRSEEPRPLYLTKLEEILQVPNEPYLTVNCAHLKEFNPALYGKLVNFPCEVCSIFDMAANEVFQDLYPEHDHIIISVRPFNIDQTYTIRGLNPNDLGKMVTISGMVTRCSSIIPEMVRAFFKCHICSSSREVPVSQGRIEEPHVCSSCNSKFCFVLIHNRCKYIDRQLIKLQESPDDMPAGQTPSTLSLVACADLVDKVNPGDRIFVTGIYKANSVRINPRIRKIKTPYRVTIECIHYRKIKSGRLHDESLHLRFNPDRIDRLKALAKDDNIYTRMAHSLCPSIFGHVDVKKGVLLQLFGGTRKETPGNRSDPKLRHFRSDVNILLCGDPGTSKSQILQYVYKLVPRGQYTSGKGSSAVGLTAYITRDSDTNQLVLQTGALVMCDGGICCIDEFDKMTDSTRSILHEVMEQQTLSVAKAGIVCQLKCAHLYFSRSKSGSVRWDRQKTVIDNIKLPDTLLSRFDLVFLLLDPNNEAFDAKLAMHLINIYHGNQDVEVDGIISQDLLKDYIAYARANIHPKLTTEARELLTASYIRLRQECHSTDGRITYYPRNLESLIRLSEAHAKMRLASIVEEEDIVEAVRLTKEAVQHERTDPTTGKIASDVIIVAA